MKNLFLVALLWCLALTVQSQIHHGDRVMYYFDQLTASDNGGRYTYPAFVTTDPNVNNEISAYIIGDGNPNVNFLFEQSVNYTIRKCVSKADAQTNGNCWSTLQDHSAWMLEPVNLPMTGDTSVFRRKSAKIKWSNEIAGIPAQFPPSTHNHQATDITSPPWAVASHTHIIGNVTGLQAAIDAKADLSSVKSYYTNSNTTTGGTAVFYITSDKTVNGTALYPSGTTTVIPIVNDANTNYTYSWAWSNSNKTLTVTVKYTQQINVTALGLTLLGVPAAVPNGTTVYLFAGQ